MTRSDVPVPEGRVYMMDASGACVAIVESDASGAYTSVPLAPGHYDIYAIASDNLAGFDLPAPQDASAVSVIKGILPLAFPERKGTRFLVCWCLSVWERLSPGALWLQRHPLAGLHWLRTVPVPTLPQWLE